VSLSVAIISLATLFLAAAVSVLLVLLARQPIESARKAREENQKDAIYRHILEVDSLNRPPMWIFRSFCPKLVAQVTRDVLAFTTGDSAETAVRRAHEIGLARGARALSQSRHSSDRVLSARLLRHVRDSDDCLRSIAAHDSDLQVRATALLSLSERGIRISARQWSVWMGLGQPHPHTSVRDLMASPALTSQKVLVAAAGSTDAPEVLRCWAIGALAERDQLAADALISELVRANPQDPGVIAGALDYLSDPLQLTLLAPLLTPATDWRVRASFGRAVQRTWAVTVMPQVAQLASDSDWRVRRSALAAMRRLGGFDSVPVPEAMRKPLVQKQARAFDGLNFEGLLDDPSRGFEVPARAANQ
jgi:HEAT repeat